VSTGPGRLARARGSHLGALLLMAAWLPATPVLAGESLQQRIDAAEPDSVISLEPGEYEGPIVIRRPLVLDGGGRAHVDAGGRHSVVSIQADGVTATSSKTASSGSISGSRTRTW